MEPAFAALVGIFVTVAVYLLLSRNLVRMLLGLAILGNGINLLILVAGRLTRSVAPILPPGAAAPSGPMANPLPQALILTAIVIGFALSTFLLVLAYRSLQALGTDEVDAMRRAEPKAEPQPPLGY
ncbi:MAG: Na+/H+ antiporter subunit C [Devosia sp.]|nr:Na+/H+ antiporter subunit C [Devosia sp.]